MTIKVLINGANGKMGQEIVKAVQAEAGLSLVATTHRGDNLAEKIMASGAQVVVDATTPEVVYENAITIIDAGAHPVIVTTGLSRDQIHELQQRCQVLKRGGIIAPNFSIAAVLLMKYAQDAVRFYPNAEIIEMHHDQKRDAPSGTALKTAEMIAANRQTTPKPLTEKEILAHVRGGKSHDIPIHSVRLSGFVASQMVLFGGTGETLTIRHDTINRECFMPGICFSCKKVVALNQLIYGLEHLI